MEYAGVDLASSGGDWHRMHPFKGSTQWRENSEIARQMLADQKCAALNVGVLVTQCCQVGPSRFCRRAAEFIDSGLLRRDRRERIGDLLSEIDQLPAQVSGGY
jgi:hypothetical protein